MDIVTVRSYGMCALRTTLPLRRLREFICERAAVGISLESISIILRCAKKLYGS